GRAGAQCPGDHRGDLAPGPGWWADLTTPAPGPRKGPGVEWRHGLPRHPHAADAPRRLLAPADARDHPHRRRPDLSGVRARAGRPGAGAVDAGRGAAVDRRTAAGGRDRERTADPRAGAVP